MIKPCAESKNQTGAILERICAAGFRILALKKTQLTKQQAEAFYEVHKGKPFYEDLTNFMSSGPIVAMVLQKKEGDAVEAYRSLIGATNPQEAAKGSIRKDFAESLQRNAVHGADSPENALRESRFFFSNIEVFGYQLA
jgi:nucleoside-diphosphate kinase